MDGSSLHFVGSSSNCCRIVKVDVDQVAFFEMAVFFCVSLVGSFFGHWSGGVEFFSQLELFGVKVLKSLYSVVFSVKLFSQNGVELRRIDGCWEEAM